MNSDNTCKQTDGQNQPMQLDLLKVLSRSTLTPTPKVCGRSRKGLYWIMDYFYNDRAFGIYNVEICSYVLTTYDF